MGKADQPTSYARASATSGGRYREFFAASVAAALLLQVTIITDTIIVGQLLGPVPMSGVRVASPIVNILNVIAMLIGVGGSTVAAIAIGRRDGKAANRAFATIRKSIMATNCNDDLKIKTCLACEETFVNIVSYSLATHVWFEASENEDALHVVLADDGDPFDPTSAVIAKKEFEDLEYGGMGIGLVRQLASNLQYRREDGRNILEIRVTAD